MATYLVTGVAGFIASRVANLLLAQGHQVIGIDNLNDAYDVRIKHWRLAQIQDHAKFTYRQVDISDALAIEKLWTDSPTFDGVVNLAARAGVRQSVKNPQVYIDTNVTGTLNLLQLCVAHDVKKFVLASTSSLYGQHNPMPYTETANTDAPLSPYAATKKGAEALCHTYHHLFGLDVTVFRYFTVYGPAGRPDMSVFRFIKWINEGVPVTIFGDGKQSRDFTYVEDIARGTVAGLKPLGYEIINLGSDGPVVLIDLLHYIESQLGKEAQIVYKDTAPGDVPATWANINKARELLNWQPETDYKTGIQKSVAWYLAEHEWAKDIVTGV